MMPAPWATCRAFQTLDVLQFENCSVQFCPGMEAAASHARLRLLLLCFSFAARGSSCLAFPGCAHSLLQRARTGVLFLAGYDIDGAGRRDARDFCAALQAVGFPLSDAGDTDEE